MEVYSVGDNHACIAGILHNGALLKFLVDEEDIDRIHRDLDSIHMATNSNGRTYVKAYMQGRLVFLHRYLLGVLDYPHIILTFKDGNGLNCTKDNILVSDKRKTLQVKYIRESDTGKVMGVTKVANGYMARISTATGRVYLGCYPTKDEAIQARLTAQEELWDTKL